MNTRELRIRLQIIASKLELEEAVSKNLKDISEPITNEIMNLASDIRCAKRRDE